MTQLLVSLYFFVGFVTLTSSRRTVANNRGFSVLGESLLLFIGWPLCVAMRTIIFMVEGNLWENLE